MIFAWWFIYIKINYLLYINYIYNFLVSFTDLAFFSLGKSKNRNYITPPPYFEEGSIWVIYGPQCISGLISFEMFSLMLLRQRPFLPFPQIFELWTVLLSGRSAFCQFGFLTLKWWHTRSCCRTCFLKGSNFRHNYTYRFYLSCQNCGGLYFPLESHIYLYYRIFILHCRTTWALILLLSWAKYCNIIEKI